jgi:Tol biopolymer transport system component
MRTRLTFASALILAVTLVAAIQSAQATYPGGNGRLGFTIFPADGSNRDIYSALPGGQGLKRLTTDAGFDACPAYSADGRQIAFCTNRSGSFEIWKMKQNGTDQTQVTNLGGFSLFPDFSPNGKRIAFSGGGPDATSDDIFVVRADGTGLVQLTSGAGNNDYPAWSPDGTKIVFISDRSGMGQVWVMNADGSNPKQLTTDLVVHDQVPDWSPDGKKIAYSAGDVNERIFVMNANGSNPHALTSGATDDFGPAWSPDGRQIAFARNFGEGDRPGYVMSADGSRQHAVLDGPVGVLAWQPRTGGEDN